MPSPSRPVPTSLFGLDGVYRFTVEQYRRMLDAGVLHESEPCELLEGYVINAPRPQSPKVATVRTRIYRALGDLPPSGWCFHSVGAIRLIDSEPEPDFLIVRGDLATHAERFPEASEVGVVGEVADTSLVFDRAEKGRIYARASIPNYWLVDVVRNVIEVYSDPDANGSLPAYRKRRDFALGSAVPLVLDGQTVAQISVADLLP